MSNKGQTLIEVIVVITVGLLVVASLTFATLFSLRNAKFSQNQNQATKLAQEGLEKVRSIRDRDPEGQVSYYNSPEDHRIKFSQLWNVNFVCDNNCYFYLASGVLTGGTKDNYEIVSSFERQFKIEDGAPANLEKRVTVIVRWNDSTGIHNSEQTTVLRKL